MQFFPTEFYGARGNVVGKLKSSNTLNTLACLLDKLKENTIFCICMSISKVNFFNIDQTEIVSLSSVEEINAIRWNKVYERFDNLKNFIDAPTRSYQGILTNKQITALKRRTKKPKLPSQIKLITIEDGAYPKLLKEIPDPPLWLFVVGSLDVLNSNCLAVVGSRKNTAYANEAINMLFSNNLLKYVTIVSGLAYGIDKLAHQISLKNSGKTIAVLAGGLDSIYPAAHRNLAKEIVSKEGALISEYPPGSPAIAYKFPIRNRIISGLSLATVVVEAAVKSGTTTTAKSVIEQNRELFVVPGDINKKSSEGCNRLIVQGANPLIYNEQLFNFFGLKNNVPIFDLKDKADVNLQTQQPADTVYRQLIEKNTVATVDQLAEDTGKSVEAILQELTVLELEGKIYQEKPGYYRVNK